eukprot:CAMPEP_0115373894 /NCGR_PEP_ID=MMETSP0271-20121206/1671_1 /TAXON_ID=71861 /ORGANISM="Scrippsiella trochoidea, Strain CCMP3099" /LENGTH=292 /DNA_ID=CAMNT_0002796919 /DNA_START=383 /DNA_END=1262 /DNA_ORIENTATION=+
MKPAYTMVVVVKVYLAANLFFHPTLCMVPRVPRLLRQVQLVHFARVQLLNSVGGFNCVALVRVFGMFVRFALHDRLCGRMQDVLRDETWALETSEHSRDMFSNSNCPWLRAGGQALPHSVGVAGEAFHSRYMRQVSAEQSQANTPGIPEQDLAIELTDALQCHERFLSREVLMMAEMATSPEDEARTIFRAIDRDGSGSIEWRELAMVLCNFGLPLSDTKAIMKQYAAKIDFDAFFDKFKPFWLYAFRRLLRSKTRMAELEGRDALSRRPSLLDRSCSTEMRSYKQLPLEGA